MKIALISETFLPQVNGVVKALEQIVVFLEKQGHEVLVITLGDGDSKFSKSKVVRVPGIKITRYQDLHITKPKEEWLAKLLNTDITQLSYGILQSLIPHPYEEVGEALNEFAPDLIHLATPTTLGSVGYYYAKQMKLPCLSTFHTDLTAYTNFYKVSYATYFVDMVLREIYNRTDRVLAPSPSSKEQLENMGIKNVGIFGRGVDNELFNPNKYNKQVIAKYGLDPSKVTIIYAGRLAEEKSISTLIEAFKTILRKNDNLQLLLVGDGPARSLLESQLMGTPHCFTGFKVGEEFAELYASADIFAFPSKTETFGQVVLEAMASGLPILGFDSQGVRDLVKNDHNGYLAEYGNFDDFTKLLEVLVANQDLRERFGRASLKEAKKRTWNAVLTGLLQEYQNLLSV